MRLDLAAKVLALATALLPFAGALERWVSFWAGDRVPSYLAWHLPITDLAAVGLRSLLAPAITFALYFFLTQALAPALYGLAKVDERMRALPNLDDAGGISSDIVRRSQERLARVDTINARIGELRDRSSDPHGTAAAVEMEAVSLELVELQGELGQLERAGELDLVRAGKLRSDVDKSFEILGEVKADLDAIPETFPRWIPRILWTTRIPRWLASMLPFIPLVIAVLLLPLAGVPPLLVGFIGYSWLMRAARRVGRLRFSDVAIPLTSLVFLSSALGGLYPTVHQPRSYAFAAAEGNVEDGDYILVGESDGLHFIVRCARSSDVLAVPVSGIAVVTIPSARPRGDLPPNLIALLNERPPLRLGFQLPPTCDA